MGQQLALIIEDDLSLSRAYRRVLTDLGYKVEISHTISEARLCIRNLAPSLILVDIELPDGNGLDLMDELRSSTRERFIVISGNTSQQAAIKSIRNRAVEFVSKPVALRELKQTIGEALATDSINNAGKAADKPLSIPTPDNDATDCWINHGSSPALVDLRTAISFSAEQRRGHALIVGEPGLEKHSVAVVLHHRARRQGKILFVDCKSSTEKELSDELFGEIENNRGRFTGAGGSIARAAGGTLVLDNVDLLSREMQSALAMFLDTGVFKPPKSEASFKAAVAVVGIISDRGKVGTLRLDFSARLGQVTLKIPSLRDCVHDIPAIAQWLLTQTTGYKAHHTFSDAIMSLFIQMPWNQNVSEMRRLIQASLDALQSSGGRNSQLKIPEEYQNSNWNPFHDLVGLTLRDFGDQLIVSTLAHCQGDKAKTAKMLNISLKTLYNRLNSQ